MNEQAEKNLTDTGLSVNYFNVLEFEIKSIENLSEFEIKKVVEDKYIELDRKYSRDANPRNRKKKELILEARDTLLTPQSRKEHIESIEKHDKQKLKPIVSEVKVLSKVDIENKDKRIPTRTVVGIDLGQTYSSIAYVNENAEPEIIPNDEFELRTPSVILFDDDVIVVGEVAKYAARAVPDQIVEFVRREMGNSKEEYSREFNGKAYSAEELSAIILKKLKNDAEAFLKTEITDAVITVPSYFRDVERQATRLAGEIAGFNVLQVISEPIAVAFAYEIDLIGEDQTVFVFDLGGGTFDVTIMNVSRSKLRMLGTGGDSRLGGKDWDDRIIEYVAENFKLKHGVDLLEDSHAYQNIQHSVIQGKKYLSKSDKIRIPCSYDGMNHIVDLTKEKFEELTADLVEKCKSTCEVVLTEAMMTWDDIDKVLLVGGSTRMLMIQKMLTKISGKQITLQVLNPEDVVALGAAVWGNMPYLYDDSQVDLMEKIIDGVTHNTGYIVYNSQGEQYIHVLIPKYAPLPYEMKDKLLTIENDQDCVLIELFQGLEQGQQEDEYIKFSDYKLGELRIELPSGYPKGTEINVTYKCNLDNTLEVMAELPDGHYANVTVNRSTLD